jgi:hypothetical protein
MSHATALRGNDKGEGTMNTTTAQDLTAAIDQSIKALAAETDAARQNEAFRLWLTTMSRFYSYSFGNQMLIAFQCPTASHVAGFRRWQSMNRFVRKGEKGIRICRFANYLAHIFLIIWHTCHRERAFGHPAGVS